MTAGGAADGATETAGAIGVASADGGVVALTSAPFTPIDGIDARAFAAGGTEPIGGMPDGVDGDESDSPIWSSNAFTCGCCGVICARRSKHVRARIRFPS